MFNEKNSKIDKMSQNNELEKINGVSVGEGGFVTYIPPTKYQVFAIDYCSQNERRAIAREINQPVYSTWFNRGENVPEPTFDDEILEYGTDMCIVERVSTAGYYPTDQEIQTVLYHIRNNAQITKLQVTLALINNDGDLVDTILQLMH